MPFKQTNKQTIHFKYSVNYTQKLVKTEENYAHATDTAAAAAKKCPTIKCHSKVWLFFAPRLIIIFYFESKLL